MSGINQSVVLDVSRIRVLFRDDIGNAKTVTGTGFWLKHEGERVFVTNKHNVDPTLKLGSSITYVLESCDIELRLFSGQNPQSATKYFSVDIVCTPPVLSADADVALFVAPKFTTTCGAYRSGDVISSDDLADAKFFVEKLALMDQASFIGYAGNTQSQWWDQQWTLGVARTVNIASVPGIPFSHHDVPTTDCMLVAGLSFSGASGSLVVLHEKSIQAGPGLHNPHYVPPKIIGIMSGHWWDAARSPAMFQHSGLSYLTRSTAVLALL